MIFTELSVAADIAWQIAAIEAGAAMHQFIEKEHIFIGICSLEKIILLGQEETRLSPQAWQSLNSECDSLKSVLKEFRFDATRIRRKVRESLGKGNYERNERVVHRSEACKEVFRRAGEFVMCNREVSCLHLLAALLDKPSEVIDRAFDEFQVKSANLRQSLIVQSNVRSPYETETGPP